MNSIKYILKNRDIILSDFKVFKTILSSKSINNCKLTDEQQKVAKEYFIMRKKIFNKQTPKFILMDEECFISSISIDINSINYTCFDISYKLQKFAVECALKQGYIITNNSPRFLKENYLVALASINKSLKSADCIDYAWNSYKKEDADKLVDELIRLGYKLNSNSALFLKNNYKLAIRALKNNIRNIKYLGETIQSNPDIFKYLVLNGYSFLDSNVLNMPLSCFKDSQILEKFVRQLYICNEKNDEYIKIFSELYSAALIKLPKIETFNELFEYYSELAWINYKKNFPDMFENLFGKITSELRNSDDFENCMSSFAHLLDNLEYILKDKYSDLYNAMEQYFKIYHENKNISKLDMCRDKISKLLSIYIAKSKEEYKKSEKDSYYSVLRKYFTIDENNPQVKKKIYVYNKKAKLAKLYSHHDKDFLEFIDEIISEYKNKISEKVITTLIEDFLFNSEDTHEALYICPSFYEYLRYEKAIKLIKRLNIGYIKYDGVEVNSYRDIISYDGVNKKFFYSGRKFTDEEIEKCIECKNNIKIYDEIKRRLINSFDCDAVDYNISVGLQFDLINHLPFNDKYYRFKYETLDKITLQDYIDSCYNAEDGGFEQSILINDDNYKVVYDLLINKGVIWTLLFWFNERKSFFDFSYHVTRFNIINSIPKIRSIAQTYHLDIEKYKELETAYSLCNCTDARECAVVGKSCAERLCKETAYVDITDSFILPFAANLIIGMHKRFKSTIPSIEGTYLNYKYTTYNHDKSILESGLDSDSCFRVGGNDNDFLHYVVLDKNGFAIKITDEHGNFIGRAAGFRNGNVLFLNQLRTIYDAGGNEYCSEYESERMDIINALKCACDNIVKISRENDLEKTKIEYVFITKSYCFDSYNDNIVPYYIWDKIGACTPVDVNSKDWEDFIRNNYDYLNETADGNVFNTDYGDYEVIMLSGKKTLERLECSDLVYKDVPALYDIKRNKIIITDKITEEIVEKINMIEAIKSYEEKFEYRYITIPKDSIVFIGDNWYIIFNKGKIIKCSVQEFDESAKKECSAAKEIIKQELLNNDNISNLANLEKTYQKVLIKA